MLLRPVPGSRGAALTGRAARGGGARLGRGAAQECAEAADDGRRVLGKSRKFASAKEAKEAKIAAAKAKREAKAAAAKK